MSGSEQQAQDSADRLDSRADEAIPAEEIPDAVEVADDSNPVEEDGGNEEPEENSQEEVKSQQEDGSQQEERSQQDQGKKMRPLLDENGEQVLDENGEPVFEEYEEIVEKEEQPPEEPEPPAPRTGFEFVIQWMATKIELDDYTPQQWKNEYNELVNDFLQEKGGRLFFWMDETLGLQISNREPPQMSEEDNGFCYFIKKDEVPSDISNETIEDFIVYGVMDRQPLDSLLDLMNSNFIPQVKREGKWPDSVKKEFLGQMHRFMSVVTDLCYKSKGTTVLYIPNENLNDPELASKDKELVQRLESILIYWTKQVRDVVNNQDLQRDNENAGPLDEIRYWNLRTVNLSRINDQISKPELQQVLKVLEYADSSNLKRFNELASLIEQGTNEADDNLRHLETLSAPCKKLGNARPSDIKNIIPEMLQKVREIWENSLHYSSSERITGLLRKISNEIINRCVSIIDINDMLGQNVLKCMADLQESLDCGQDWKKIFELTASKIVESEGKPWNFNTGSIFSQVDAFVQRCMDLKQICEGQLQFARKDIPNQALPAFGGTRGREIKENILEIERSFDKQIERIKVLGYDILDVKITRWHGDYTKFKQKMKHLENIFKTIINLAFEGVTTVNQGAEMLEAFDSLAKRDSIKQHVQKKAEDVYDRFKQDLDQVKREYDKREDNPPIATYHPRYGGTALWLTSLLTRINRQKAKLDQLSFIRDESAIKKRDDVFKKYDKLVENLKTYVNNTLYNKWKYEVDEMSSEGLQKRMKKPVFARGEEDHNVQNVFDHTKLLQKRQSGEYGSLSSDFDKGLMKLVAEVKCWEKLTSLSIMIPSEWHEIANYREEFRIIKESVLMVVTDYNNIMGVLDENEKKLFDYHLKYLNKKLEPGWRNNIDWNNKAIVSTSISDWRKQCTDTLSKVLHYKNNNNRLNEQYEIISNIKLLHLERKHVHECDAFEMEQGRHLNDTIPVITEICSEMMKIIMDTYEILKPTSEGRYNWTEKALETSRQQWRIRLKEIDQNLEEALKKAIRSALAEFNKAINGDGKNNEPNPIFRLHVTLDEQQQKTEFRPTREQLKEMIYRVLNQIVQITQHVHKFKHRFYKELTRIAAETDKLTPSTALQRTLARSITNPGVAAIEESKKEEEEDKPLKTIRNFERDKEIQGLISRIIRGIEKCNRLCDDILQTWMQEQFRSVWQSAKAPFLKRMKARKPDAPSYKESIQYYNGIKTEVSNERNTVAKVFVLIDNSEIQTLLKNFCMEWINSIIDVVNEMGKEELYRLHDIFDSTTRQLRIEPKDIHYLKRSREKLEEQQGKIDEYQRDIESVQIKYEFLNDNDTQITGDEEAKLAEMDEKFGDWKEMLNEVSVSLDRTFKEFEKEFEKSWKDYEKAVEESYNEFKQKAPFSNDNVDNPGAKKVIKEFRQRVAQLKERESDMQHGVKLFNAPAYTPAAIGKADHDLDLLDEIWELKARWDDQWDRWKSTQFTDLNLEVMTEITKEFLDRLKELEKELKTWGIHQSLLNSINVFLDTMPIIAKLSHRAIKDRHWNELRGEIKNHFDENSAEFNLEYIFNLRLHQYAEIIEDLFERAKQQLIIDEKIQEVDHVWNSLELDVATYKEQYLKLRSTDLIYQTLEDHIVTLSSMKTQIHAEYFLPQIGHWELTLSQINETIELLIQVQSHWVYLESIFVGQDDIRKQLNSEYAIFMRVNEKFMEEMRRIHDNPNALKALCHPGFYDNLQQLNLDLDSVQKSLNQFLEKQRQKFPRFYFLSDEDLLVILGQSKNPNEIQPHIKKLFEGIKNLDMKQQGKRVEGGERAGKSIQVNSVQGLRAPDGEYVALDNKVTAEGAVETWLSNVEKSMQNTLQRLLIEVHQKIDPKNKTDWVKQWPGQLLITAGQIKWTNDTQNCLKSIKGDEKKHPLKSQMQSQKKNIDKFVDMVRSKITEIERNKLIAIITIEQHAWKVLGRLVEKGVSDVNDFEWMQQLRFYLDKERPELDYGICLINQTNTSFEYGYEYQGNNGRLVVTELTDRCYVTLTTALYLKRGGAPQGPAGTGKTETVKDLGKNMAKFVIVINCSESMDFTSLGRLFSGFAQSGAWGCLDEFNRILLEVLSVIAQQIAKIQSAIRENKTSFNFEGATIPLNMGCGIFITMNPGYAGRSELPDNLKSLFRPISMMAADLQLIAEIMLFSEGFKSAVQLSKKINTLYNLMVKQFSKQDHYEFGMRSLKAVLNCAGSFKRQMPQQDEMVLLMQALYDMTIPRLVQEDIDLFYPLLYGTFSGVELMEDTNDILRSAVISQLEQDNLQVTEMIVTKILQLYGSHKTRHGNMLVGQALSGKSTVWKTLQKVQTNLNRNGVEGFEQVRVSIINPKALNSDELYGSYDSAGEWTDGVLSTTMRQLCADETTENRWLLLDGPVDTLWVENMNSLLDDNKLLTLINGDRIALPNNVRLLFEVENLSVASPATVSRTGMIYMDVNQHGYLPYYNSWVASKDGAELQNFLHEMFEKYVPKTINYKQKECKELVPITPINSVIALTKVYDSFANTADLSPESDDYWYLLEKWFIFALIWSVCASVDENSRQMLDTFIREIETGFPHLGLIFDYYINLEKKDWVSWADKLQAKPTIPAGTPFHKILIPTIDTQRNLEVMKHLVNNGHFVLSVGSTGVGKTALITTGLLGISLDDRFTHFTLSFSGQTSAQKTQDIIENNLEKRTSNKRGPPGNKRCLLFVDDLNMPRKEFFGAQPPLELLRQWSDYGYWYDRKKQTPLYVLDMQMVAAMGPPGGGRAEISQRIQCHFNLVNFTFPEDKEIFRIFYAILNHHLQDFEEDVKQEIENISHSTIQLYKRVTEEFLPTPTKSHYLFNMRDISKVFLGMYKADKGFHDSKESLFKLWVHECLRVFHDRLISYTDQEQFKQLLEEQLQTFMSVSYESCCSKIVENDQEIMLDPLFIDGNVWQDPVHVYDLVEDRSNLKTALEEKLDAYNLTPRNIEMNLVLFKEAINYLTRIHRVLKQQGGHALLVGVGGSGRHSLTRLAAYIAGFDYVQLEITKSYKLQEFREDIKKMKFRAGPENHPLVFVFSDNDVVNELFLEDINNLLNSGEVPNIYTNDEIKDVKEAMRKEAKRLKKSETSDALWQLFIDNVKTNLHIAFCISPIGSKFRDYCRVYPSLINNTTISWFMPWPRDALYEVAKKFVFEKLDFKQKIKESISQVFCNMHVDVMEATTRMYNELKRNYYVTPTHYLELVLGYIRVLKNKQEEIMQNISKLRGGLDKLESSKAQVEEMSKELEITKTEVSKKQKQCEDLSIQISQEQAKADKSQKEVEQKAEEIERERKGVMALTAEAEAQLEKALPALIEAEEALEKLDKKEISEVKAYSQPPKAVETVMEAVLVIISKEKPSWANAKKELNDPNFMSRIRDFDKENIPNKTLKKLEHYTQRNDFIPQNVAYVSSAAGALCQWVHAMESFAKTFRDVEPKRQNVRALQANLNNMEKRLGELRGQLQELTDMIVSLDQQLKAQEEERELYDSQAKELQLKLERAEKLVSGLGSERSRWSASLLNLEEMYTKLPGDCLISSAFLSYNGAFTAEYRDELIEKKWLPLVHSKEIPITAHFNFVNFMTKPTEIREWNLNKLPTDKFSIENAILTTRSERWPLMIDPQSQGNNWIKAKEEGTIKIVNPQQRYVPIFETAVRMGLSVLMEDIGEDIDPWLDPILKKSFKKSGTVFAIKLGDKELQYNFNFKLYLTTRNGNPTYTPEISTKVTLINFQVKQQGLEEQLLGILVRKENKQIEDEKDTLVVNIANNNKKIVECEDQILDLLFNTTGSLLDDENLVLALQTAKETSEIVKGDLEVSESTMRKINSMRENYRPCATKSSVLFFVLAGLSVIDPMYQFSLNWYIELFQDSIDRSKEKYPVLDPIPERISHLDRYHMKSVYTNTCRGLFEKHKLLLSLQMCVEFQKLNNNIDMQEYDFFLRGGVGIADGDQEEEKPPNPDTDWITDEMWDNITELSAKLPNFNQIDSSIIVSRKEWKHWFQSTEPEKEPLPGEWDAKANDLRRMILLRIIRPDRVIPAVIDFVSTRLDPEYVIPPNFVLEEVYNDTSKSTQPLLFVLSPGVDPAASLKQLADDKGKDLEVIPLGRGQEVKAEKAIQEGSERGFWVFLANCHLAISWMPRLDEILEGMSKAVPHEDFRMWLSSDPDPKFPIPILQRCAKITTEPPKGIKSNMLRLYNQVGQRYFDRLEPNAKQKYKRLLFSLCWYHSILVERKVFKNLGWNVTYSFNDSDWEVSENIIAKYLGVKEEGDKMEVNINKIPWDAIKYLISDISYGGRVTDERDKILQSVYAQECFNPRVVEEAKYPLCDNSSVYIIPDDTNVKMPPDMTNPAMFFIKYIKDYFPNIDRPEAFGQHINAQISSQISDTKELLTCLVAMQPQAGGGANDQAEDTVLHICEDLKEKIPKALNLDEIKQKLRNEEGPLITVLLQEAARYNILLNYLHQDIKTLVNGIKGLVVISEETENVFRSLFLGKVPQSWNFAYPSLKPLASWTKDLIARIKQLKDWAYDHQPIVFWISGFTYPTGFTTAMTQQAASDKQCSIDSLNMEHIMVPLEEAAIAASPREGLYIKGLHLEGAKWDYEEMCLMEPEPMELTCSMPIIHFRPVKEKKKNKGSVYECPCYYFSVRTGSRERPSFMFNIELKCGEQTKEYWIKRGTALLMNLDI